MFTSLSGLFFREKSFSNLKKLSFIKAHGMTQCDQSYYHKNHCLAHTNMTF
jgi:hypothetical protein